MFKQLFRKNIKTTELSPGEKEFFHLKNLEVENTGITSTRLIVTIDQIYRAWVKGYTNFEAIYKPEPRMGVSIMKLNDRLQQLSNLGVDYIAKPIDNDPTQGVIISIKR